MELQELLANLLANVESLDDADKEVLLGLAEKYAQPEEPTPVEQELPTPSEEELPTETPAAPIEEPTEELPIETPETPAVPGPEEALAAITEQLSALESKISNIEEVIKKLVVTESDDEEEEYVGHKSKGPGVAQKEDPAKDSIIAKLGGYAR